MGLHRQQHRILGPGIGRHLHGAHVARVLLGAVLEDQLQAVGRDGLEVAVARHHRDLLARERELRAEVTTDGPCAEGKEVIGGYWIIEAKDLADAIAWARQAPCPAGEMIEIRPVWTPEDFGPEAAAVERAQMEQIEAQKKNG